MYAYALVKRLLSDSTETVEVVLNGVWRPAITIKEPRKADRYTESFQLSGGIYAIFTHKGDTDRVREVLIGINGYWLPKSKYERGSGPLMSYICITPHWFRKRNA